jgi:hypothetical protein
LSDRSAIERRSGAGQAIGNDPVKNRFLAFALCPLTAGGARECVGGDPCLGDRALDDRIGQFGVLGCEERPDLVRCFDADGSASVIPLYLNDRVMVDATSAMHRPLQFQRQDLRRASRCRRGRIFTPGLATAFAIFFILAVAAFNQAGRFGSALGGA